MVLEGGGGGGVKTQSSLGCTINLHGIGPFEAWWP
jgi:hypothetical protein